MITNRTTTDRKAVLSTAWIFVMFTYIYADLAPMIFDPAAPLGSSDATDGVVLGFAIFMQTAIAMILLSRVLPYEANRWANIIVGALHAVIISWSLFAGSPPVHYIFSATIVIACTLFILWDAWTWTDLTASPNQISSIRRK